MNNIILKEFNRLLKCNADMKVDYSNTVNIVHEDDDNGDEELRYCLINGILIISRVNINNKRNGVFTSLISIFVNNAAKFGINKIVIQAVSTEEMYRWCLKNEYKEVGNGWGGILRGDFAKELDNVQNNVG